ncbi:MAG: hypothetical protein II859_10370 [Bacteroidales bacterium]|nr:hypothetical protein [Bacteroidales bacterium]
MASTEMKSLTLGGVTRTLHDAVARAITHTANTTVSTSTTTITFTADQRCSKMITVSADLGVTFAVNNTTDNYLWIKNTGSAEVDITVSAVTSSGNNVANVYMPADGISIPAGKVVEIGIIVNADGAFITSRNDLAL